MKKPIVSLLLLFIILQFCSPPEKTYPKRESRLPRENSFFGIHFDLHASENDEAIGASLTEAMIDSFLTAVDPDFIQIDCKGHPGISSYPTEVGFQAKSYVGDPLMLWRKVTAEHNVSLYMHFSGIYDRKVVAEHPDWATLLSDGSRSDRTLSVFSPYNETYLIPQLKELAGKYKVDGAWVDGECWAFEADYGPEALAEYLELSETRIIPHSPDDPAYDEFMDFQRSLFKRHVQTYLDAVHTEYPDFQMTSNWAFSSMMPEQVDLDLDYLSGDVIPGNAVNNAAFEARCMASQDMPWDLMLWSFSWSPGGSSVPNHTKTALQLNQELAEVMAMGGGVQGYFKQNRDISIQPWTIPIMTEIASFCRERQAFCYKTEPVPSTAILYSGYSYKKNLRRVYPSGDWSLNPLKGCLTAVLDGQHSAEILMEHHLRDRIEEYSLIIIPSWQEIDPGIKPLITEYVKEGGKVLLIGPGPINTFSDVLEIRDINMSERANWHASDGEGLLNVRADLVEFTPSPDMEVSDYLYGAMDLRYKENTPAVAYKNIGKGRIGLISFDLGAQYADGPQYRMRNLLSNVINELYPDPVVTLTGSHLVHVALNTLGDATIINLINTAGKHSDQHTLGFDEIPAVGPLEISLKVDRKPHKVMLQPQNLKLSSTYSDGLLRMQLKKLDLYEMIVIE